MTTITVNTWGRNANLPESFAVRVQDGESQTDAVRRSIERRTGHTVYTFSDDGTALSNNEPVATHFRFALTRRARHGGHTVHCEGWVSIPLDTRPDELLGW